jgi:alkylation response protein AidB-like acyl-CoA dehydrogenase
MRRWGLVREGAMVTAVRELPTTEARDLLGLVRDLVADKIAPFAPAGEAAGTFPRDLVAELGSMGLLGLPFSPEFGGGGQPYQVYLQVLEEIAAGWLTVAETISVHTLAVYPLASYGTDQQRKRWLEGMICGDELCAFCLSEPHSGSDASALTTRAEAHVGSYVVNGTKAWITHAGHASFYSLMARTGGPGAAGISCLLVDGAAPGLSAGPPERKMGLRSSPVAQVRFESVEVPADRLIGAEGQGFTIAMSALDSGRLGIAACAVGLAQAALDQAVRYTGERMQFGRPIHEFQGVSSMLADMATGVEAGRQLYLRAARLRDAGQPFAKQSAMAKLFCTDMAMRVTTDAVQVLGEAGYTEEFPVERYMREAKVLQIFEGTNQIQRLVVGRHLVREAGSPAGGGAR